MNTRVRLFTLAFVAFAQLGLVLVASTAAAEPPERGDETTDPQPDCHPEGDFNLVFLRSVSLESVYDIEQAWPIIEKAPLDQCLFALSENDVTMLDWPDQKFVLTADASKRLADFSLQSKSLAVLLEMKPFVVVLKGERLYGGVVLYPGSARGIGYPVLYIDESPELYSLAVRPFQGGIVDYRKARETMEKQVRGRIEFGELAGFFKGIGKLTE